MAKKNYVLTLQTLKIGIWNWKYKYHWPSDFHNQDYLELQRQLENGITPSIWNKLVDRLSAWRANRPLSKSVIRERGLSVLDTLNAEVEKVNRLYNKRPTLSDVEWHAIEGLYLITHRIKNVTSPVFASKLCHFIFPDVFPVIDNEYIGVLGDYKEYWRLCQKLWVNATPGLKNELINELQSQSSSQMYPIFPWSTKIVEMCLSAQ